MDDVFTRLREDYVGTPLTRDGLPGDPLEQFTRWFDEAVSAQLQLANGMTLATVDADGRPSARIVLLKSFDARGFVFYTNYASRKARALEDTGRAALLFWWQPLHRQIRIEGRIERIDEVESDRYFASRPRTSNLGAMASPQSAVIEDRQWLQDEFQRVRGLWDGRPLERPTGWGGYRVVAEYFEFWQGREDRLHDRLCYTARPDDQWRIERLAP